MLYFTVITLEWTQGRTLMRKTVGRHVDLYPPSGLGDLYDACLTKAAEEFKFEKSSCAILFWSAQPEVS